MESTFQDFVKAQAQLSAYPLGFDVVKAEGPYLYSSSGKRYTDLVSGIGVANLGHGNTAINEAIKNQVDAYLHVMVYGELVQEQPVKAAQLLLSYLPPSFESVYFVNSGAEATEGALKLAKRATGRTKIVSCLKSYHGSTHGALSVSGNEQKKYAFRPLLPEVYFMEFNNLNHLDLIDENTAAVLIETVQGDAGIRIPTKEWLVALREKCTEVGAILIFDEIQCGMGRTGKRFAFEHYNVVPDILTLGKALGGGLPIGAFVSSKALMHELTYNPPLGHITTFGGHPVICAAAHAFLQQLTPELLAGVEPRGAYIKQQLIKNPYVQEIRQIGLYMAVDLPSEAFVAQVVDQCLNKGLITFFFLSCRASFRLAPPLNTPMQVLEESCAIINEVILQVGAEL